MKLLARVATLATVALLAATFVTTAANAQVSRTGQPVSTSSAAIMGRTSGPSHTATQFTIESPKAQRGNWHFAGWFYDEAYCTISGLAYGIAGHPWYCQPIYVGPWVASWWLYVWY